MKTNPLADSIRPTGLEDIVGQQHILGQGRILRNMIENGRISNMIFHGPSGTGKTTLANIIANKSGRKFYKLNATSANVGDVREVIAQAREEGGVLLYLDEIQNFNKKQQQSLLEFIETGDIVLIASTTENPYFYVYNAILSRSTVFEFKPLSQDDIVKAVTRAGRILGEQLEFSIEIEPEALSHVAQMANGDVRRALNALEIAAYNTLPNEGTVKITLEQAEQASQKRALAYDKLGDNHYDILSALQKSLRGSDPNAALHYLARLIEAGDLPSACRRILVTAAEDIGLAYPMAVPVVKACIDSALQLGLPEARIPLSQAVILLATAPKSNATVVGIDMALADLSSKDPGEIPAHIRDSNYSGAAKMGRGEGYKYPHDYPNHYLKQEYMPKNLRGRKYYIPQDNKFENSLKEYWDKIKGNDNGS